MMGLFDFFSNIGSNISDGLASVGNSLFGNNSNNITAPQGTFTRMFDDAGNLTNSAASSAWSNGGQQGLANYANQVIAQQGPSAYNNGMNEWNKMYFPDAYKNAQNAAMTGMANGQNGGNGQSGLAGWLNTAQKLGSVIDAVGKGITAWDNHKMAKLSRQIAQNNLDWQKNRQAKQTRNERELSASTNGNVVGSGTGTTYRA